VRPVVGRLGRARRRKPEMVTIDCPWCHEDELFALNDDDEPEASFTCPDCGTSVVFVKEPTAALDLAA
jgi:predicted RNA-binding Zn-ribbon protein involved in translation (DUF1610 family)